MTHATALARAEHFDALAAAMFYEAETARRARLYSDAAELTCRATRASRTAADYRREASRMN
jgi:hypothetical protein